MNKIKLNYIELVIFNLLILVSAIYTRFKYIELNLNLLDSIICTSIISLVPIFNLRKILKSYNPEEQEGDLHD